MPESYAAKSSHCLAEAGNEGSKPKQNAQRERPPNFPLANLHALMLAILTVPPNTATEAVYRLIEIIALIAEAVAAHYAGKPIRGYLIGRSATRFCDDLRQSLEALAAEIEARQQELAASPPEAESPVTQAGCRAQPAASTAPAQPRRPAPGRPAQIRKAIRAPIPSRQSLTHSPPRRTKPCEVAPFKLVHFVSV